MAKRTFAIVAVFAALLSVTISVQADTLDYYWAGGSGDYATASNWKVGSITGETASASLDDSGNKITTYIYSNTGDNGVSIGNNIGASVYNLNIGQTGVTAKVKYSDTSSNFTLPNLKTISICQGGTFEFASSGKQLLQNGTINISGGTLNFSSGDSYRVGNDNYATLYINSGTLTVDAKFYAGVNASSKGTIKQTGGSATFTKDFEFGWGPNNPFGEYILSGGSITTTQSTNVGLDCHSSNASYFTVCGENASAKFASFTVGLNGTKTNIGNTFTLSSGTVTTTGAFTINKDGILNVTGGSFTTNTFSIASGTVTQSGGTFKANSFSQSGGTVTASAINLNDGAGTYTQSGGILNSGVTITGSYNKTAGTLAYSGLLDVSQSAAIDGTIDTSNFLAKPAQKVTFVKTTNGVSGSYTFSDNKWTPAIEGNNLTATYSGDTNVAYWNKDTGNSFVNYDAGSNWIEYVTTTDPETGVISGQWQTVGTTWIFGNTNTACNKTCYILPYYDSATSTVKDVKVKFNNTYTQVSSLTIGNGVGGDTGNVTVKRDGELNVQAALNVNKGGSFTVNGKFSVTSGSNTNGLLTVNGGEFIVNTSVDTSNVDRFVNNKTITISNGGKLKFAGTGNGSLGSMGSGTINNNATLEFAIGTDDANDTNIPELTFNNAITGTGTIIKTGKGTLKLQTSSSIANDIIIENGVVAISNSADNSDRFTGTITVNKGGTLRCDVHDCTGYLGNKAATINLYGGTLALNVSSGYKNETLIKKTINLRGGTITTLNDADSSFHIFKTGNAFNVEANSNATQDNPTVSYIKGNLKLRNKENFNITVDENAKLIVDKNFSISDNSEATHPLVKLGPGVLVFEGSNSYTKGTTISEGTLILTENGTLGTGNVTNNATLEFAHADTKAFSNVISGIGVVNKTGAGTLELSGANTYSGGTTISAGTLKLSGSGALGTGNIVDNATLEFAHTGTQSFSNVISGTGSVTKTGSAGVLDITGANTYSGGTTITNGAIRLLGNGTLGSGEISIGSSSSLWFGGDLVGVTISNDISGAGSIVKQGYYNTVTLNGNLTNFTGQLTINGETNYRNSTISLSGANANLLNSSGVTVNGTLDVTGYTGSTTMQLNKLSGAGNVNLGSKSVKLNNGEGVNTEFSGNINGTGNVTKAGAGTLTLSGANTYSGDTTISAGTLKLNGSTATLGAGAVTIAENAALEISGAPRGLHSVTSLSGSGDINITGTGNSFLSLANANAQDYNGTINVTGKLHIGYQDSNNKDRYTNLNLPNATVSLSTSGAQLALDQDDNYQDTTTLTIKTLNGVAGTYVRAGGQALYFDPPGYSTITVGDGVFQGVIGTNTTSYPCFNNISLIKNTTGTLTLSGANTYTGGTTVSGGVLELTGDAIVANGQVYVDTNGTLKYSWNGSGDKTLTIDAVAKKIYGTGKVIVNADEEAVLKIYTSAKGMIDVQSLTISSGRVDIKDYFDGQLIVQGQGTFSPGNSVGTLIIGDGTYGDGGFILNEAGAELLMEIGGAAPSANDGLIVNGDITFKDGSVITLVNNSNLGLGESFTAILSADNSANLDVLGHIQTADFTELKYVQINDATHGTVYAITGRTFNANEIPEPSTWALLILGAAGMLYWRKRKNA